MSMSINDIKYNNSGHVFITKIGGFDYGKERILYG